MNKIILTTCFSLILCVSSFSSDVKGNDNSPLVEEDISPQGTLFIIPRPTDINGLAIDEHGNINAVTASGAEKYPFAMGAIDLLMPVFDTEGNFMYLLGDAMGLTGPGAE